VVFWEEKQSACEEKKGNNGNNKCYLFVYDYFSHIDHNNPCLHLFPYLLLGLSRFSKFYTYARDPSTLYSPNYYDYHVF
jgi:hypothetical protein